MQSAASLSSMLPAVGAATDPSKIRNLRLRKFEMAQIPDDSVIVFIGKRNTGKSFLIKDLLWHKRTFPVGTVLSGTEGANAFYSQIVPSLLIHEEFTPNIIANVIKRQQNITKMQMKEKAVKGSTAIDRRTFIIMDDCMYDNKWVSDRNIRSLFMNGRHYGIMYILALQYVMGIPPVLRGNVDYVFILRENMVANRRRIYEQFAGIFPTFEFFCQIMDQCTENFECLVIHNGSTSGLESFLIQKPTIYYNPLTYDENIVNNAQKINSFYINNLNDLYHSLSSIDLFVDYKDSFENI